MLIFYCKFFDFLCKTYLRLLFILVVILGYKNLNIYIYMYVCIWQMHIQTSFLEV